MMEQTFSFAYGDTVIPMTIRAREIEVLEPEEHTPLADLPEAFRAAVEEQAIASAPLKDLITPDDQVTVVISDLTRAWMHQEMICPLLVDYLHDRCGVSYDAIVFLVALGTHRMMTEDELKRITGERVYGLCRVLNHRADEPLTCVGTTPFGTEVWVNPLAVGRKVITMGGTVHHLMAGYGGGRKSILPGICGEKTISQNHIRALDPDAPHSSPLVGCGRLDHNPVNDDMVEAARLVGPVFGINLVVDGIGRHLALPSGNWHEAWLESCRLVDRYNGVPIQKRADVVVASTGGFPKDINLYQGCKTMINARNGVKDGGQIFFLCECREGGGPAAFFGWSKPLADGFLNLDAELRKRFTIAGYIFYACVEIALKTDVHMLSMLPADVLRDMKITGHTAEEMQRMMDFGDRHVIVMPHGGATFPMPLGE